MGLTGVRPCCRVVVWSCTSLLWWGGSSSNSSSSSWSHWSVRGVIPQTPSFVISIITTSHSPGISANLARGTGRKEELSATFLLVVAARIRGPRHLPLQPLRRPPPPWPPPRPPPPLAVSPIGVISTWEFKPSNSGRAVLHSVIMRRVVSQIFSIRPLFVHHFLWCNRIQSAAAMGCLWLQFHLYLQIKTYTSPFEAWALLTPILLRFQALFSPQMSIITLEKPKQRMDQPRPASCPAQAEPSLSHGKCQQQVAWWTRPTTGVGMT